MVSFSFDSLIGPLLLGYVGPETKTKSNKEEDESDDDDDDEKIIPKSTKNNALTKTPNGMFKASELSMPPPRPIGLRNNGLPSLLDSKKNNDGDDESGEED